MQINKHKAARLKKADNMKLVFSKTSELKGSHCTSMLKNEFNKNAKKYLTFSKVIAIYEGETKVLIIYNGG